MFIINVIIDKNEKGEEYMTTCAVAWDFVFCLSYQWGRLVTKLLMSGESCPGKPLRGFGILELCEG